MNSEPNTRPITAIILTYNEEKHIARCIRSIQALCARILIIDSDSTDRTTKIARELGAEILVRPWPNKYAEQFNWGIDRASAQTPWMLRIDADEYLSDELREELQEILPTLPADVTGLVMPRLVMFQNKPIRHGGFYPQWLLRVWRTGAGRCEDRMMDEHMVLAHGRTKRLSHDLIDHNLNDIYWWTNKHNNYARREAADLVQISHRLGARPSGATTEGQAATKRWIKENVYSRLPTGLRAALYFQLRFALQGGFLDHPRVWIFHFLQAMWYRTLVDVNVQEFEDAVGTTSSQEKLEYLRKNWNIKTTADSE